MRCLEVFCGTKSVSKTLPADWEVVSVDNLAKFQSTILAEVATWDYTTFAPGHFDYIHFSPPCTEFSRALTSRPRRLEEGDILAKRSLEILSYFCPRWWTLENPVGLLQTWPYMEDFIRFRRFVCYCKYNEGDHPYRKQTVIWTNILAWNPRPMCNKESPCADKAKKGKHLHHAQQGALPGLRKTLTQLYSFPPALAKEWIAAILVESGGFYCLGLINRNHICFTWLPYPVFWNSIVAPREGVYVKGGGSYKFLLLLHTHLSGIGCGWECHFFCKVTFCISELY